MAGCSLEQLPHRNRQNRNTTSTQIFPGADAILEKLRSVKGDSAQYALKQKLVDKLYTNEQVEDLLSKHFGWNKEDKQFNNISIYDYSTKIADTNANQSGNIAVIVVQGAIMDGPQTLGLQEAIPSQHKFVTLALMIILKR